MKKYVKILSIMLVVIVAIMMISTAVYGNGMAFTPGNMTADVAGTEGIQSLGNRIFGIVQVVGVVIAVVILVVLGIKYMMGSAEEKAEYKKTLLPYIIGAILIAAAVPVAGMIFGWGADVANSL